MSLCKATKVDGHPCQYKALPLYGNLYCGIHKKLFGETLNTGEEITERIDQFYTRDEIIVHPKIKGIEFVYFGCSNATKAKNEVKIGITKNMSERLRTYRTFFSPSDPFYFWIVLSIRNGNGGKLEKMFKDMLVEIDVISSVPSYAVSGAEWRSFDYDVEKVKISLEHLRKEGAIGTNDVSILTEEEIVKYIAIGKELATMFRSE
jgi:hypothetical protein